MRVASPFALLIQYDTMRIYIKKYNIGVKKRRILLGMEAAYGILLVLYIEATGLGWWKSIVLIYSHLSFTYVASYLFSVCFPYLLFRISVADVDHRRT